MDFSDSFFQDSFRCDKAINIPERTVKTEPPSLSELVPTGLSLSPLDSDALFDKFGVPKFDSNPILATDFSATLAASRDVNNTSPPFFYPEGLASFAEATQPTFFLDQPCCEIEIPESAATLLDMDDEEKPSVPLSYFGVEENRKSMASAVAAAATAATIVDRSLGSHDLTESTSGSMETASAHSSSLVAGQSSKTPRAAAALTRKSASDFETPDGFKLYRMRRERNNEASRRSRTKFRQKAREMEEEVQDLRQQNSDLKRQLHAMTANMEELQRRLNPSNSSSGTALL